MNNILNERLMSLSAHLHIEDKMIDIGCDHALLDIYLIKKYPEMKIVASDVSKGPLEFARKNLLKYHLKDKIALRLGDGLEVIDEDIDTIVISGMGTTTILNILKDLPKYPWIRKIVLSPNNDFELLRKNINSWHFKIKEEELILDKGKYYLIMELEKGEEEVNTFFGKLDLKSSIVRDFYKMMYEKNQKILKEEIDAITRAKLIEENYQIEKTIK